MDPQQPTGEAVPMSKQEIVKEDGRTLTYYTFPSDGEGDRAPQSTGGNAEAAHV